jgi:hypothetical protein
MNEQPVVEKNSNNFRRGLAATSTNSADSWPFKLQIRFIQSQSRLLKNILPATIAPLFVRIRQNNVTIPYPPFDMRISQLVRGKPVLLFARSRAAEIRHFEFSIRIVL